MHSQRYGNPEVVVTDDVIGLAEEAAAHFARAAAQELSHKPELGVILALGATQDPFFTALKARVDIEWSRINVFQVDTYLGVPDVSPGSFGSMLREKLLNDVKPKAFYPIMGDRLPVEEELARYTALLDRFDPQICLVGIGVTGHLAFNDPPADFATRDLVRVVALSEVTRDFLFQLDKFVSLDAVPRYGFSLTMHALMRPNTVMCLVGNPDKAGLVKAALDGPVTVMMPASIMQAHRSVHVYLTQGAASELESLSIVETG